MVSSLVLLIWLKIKDTRLSSTPASDTPTLPALLTLHTVAKKLPEEGQHRLGPLTAIALDCGKFEGHEIIPCLRLN